MIEISEGCWPQDRTFLAQLHQSWITQYAEYIGQPAAEALVARLLECNELYPRANQPLLLARINDELIAAAALRVMKGLSLITLLEVLEPAQGQGVGTCLLAKLESRNEPLLAHVSIHRPWVKAFYERSGFAVLDRAVVDHYGYALEFDVVLKKNE